MSRVSDYAFINAKLRARIGIMRESSLFDEMIKAPSLTEAIAKLDGTHHAGLLEVYRKTGDLQQVELQMLEDEIALYREVGSYLPSVPSEFLSVLLEKIEVDNVKNCIRLWYSDAVRHHLISYRSSYIYKGSIVHRIDYDAVINAVSYPELLRAFRDTPYAEVLSSFSLESIASRGLFPLEIALDHMWFRHLDEGIRKLHGRDRKTAEEIYSVDADLKNILMLTRYSYSYHLSPEDLEKVMIPMGYIVKEAQKMGALSSDDPIAVISGIVKHRYPRVSEEIARIRRTADDLTTVDENNREIVLIEAYLGERRQSEYRKILMGDPFSIGVVLAYFFLCLQEDGTLRAILSGKYYGWSEDKIREGIGL